MRRLVFVGILFFFAMVATSVNAGPLGANIDNLRLPNSETITIGPRVQGSSATMDMDDMSNGGDTTFSGVHSSGYSMGEDSTVRQYNVNRPKSWAIDTLRPDSEPLIPYEQLPVFGRSLFNGNFSGTYYDERNPEYVIRSGDRIGVRIWGAFNFEQELVVDRLGNIFIQTVGPVTVAGVKNDQIPKVIRSAVNKVYSPKHYEAYIDLITPHPISVFVAGFVVAPGRYAGGTTDSVLFFLDIAGGINSKRGSFRDIEVVRKGRVVGRVDLYDFLTKGRMDVQKLEDGDTLVVKRRGMLVGVNGHVRMQAWFEFKEETVTGAEVMKWVDPSPGVSHVRIIGHRRGQPFHSYLPVSEFASFKVEDNDKLEFMYDEPSDTISVYAEGALKGRSHFFVEKGTRLNDVLDYIAVDKGFANLKSIYLRRASVAERQASALRESLFRLEQNALTSTSGSVDEASIRVREAELINKFVEKAKHIKPQGIVAITHDGERENVYLQDGDTIVIPNHSDVVLTSGEVVVPNAVVYNPKYTIKDYIAQSGGFSNKADSRHIILFKSDGSIGDANSGDIEAGDSIMVLPKYETKYLQFAKDLTQIFFQIAVGSRALVDIF